MIQTFELETTTIETKFGSFIFHCFSWGAHEEDNILVLEKKSIKFAPLVRIQSACYTAEIFRSLDCDCHAQLSKSQQLIAGEGGYLVYMLCDGRGAGLLNKVRGLELGRLHGMDTSEAYRHLNIEQDPRNYSRVNEILSHFEFKEIRLLTNNPRKIDAVIGSGIKVTRHPLEIESTTSSAPYLKTKALKMGHMLREFRK
ncbi:GTP cyclohydrolase II RibA [Pseudomonas sp. BGI-2]|uniref:GTP cyclohydrolase II RibA n=1 Tax=Pseudomonas sp. BGI-2 TaxID=2528211 RepID=UPI00103523F1|nr:GTP cyclohydrolase II RibA [Pseudomonas sp. BGI-2]TBN47395.1 GTP cyclohydrolase II RibA [Pseudomonas sp. BGI-2]